MATVHASDDLRETIGQLHALEMAVRSARLSAIAEYDERELWAEDGSTSMSVWLSALTGAREQSAKEEVRVARALRSLPCLTSAFEAGALPWDKVAAVTRFATPDTDRTWTGRAHEWSAFALEREARRAERTCDRDDGHESPEALRCWWSRDRRRVKVNGELQAEGGATLLAELERRAGRLPRDPDTGELAPLERRMAQALVELAGIAIARDSDPDRATVVVHVSDQALAGAGHGLAELEAGAQLRLDAIRRMVCDGRVEFAICDHLGRTVGIGRASRKIPPWLERQVLARDGDCQFPGCDRTTLLHSHHAIPWWDGGPTNLSNLVAICAVHHRAVHDRGWRVIPLGEGRFRFVRPDGLAVLPRPMRLRPWVRERFLGAETTLAEPNDSS